MLRVGLRLHYLVPRQLSLDVLQFGLTSLTIVAFPLWVFVHLPKGGALYADLRRFPQVCLTQFSIDLLQHCTVQYHEQENHFIIVLPSSWSSAGDWIVLNFVSCYMTAPGDV